MRGLIRAGWRGLAILGVTMLLLTAPPVIRPAEADSAAAEASALMKAGANAIERGEFDKAAANFSNALDSGGLTPEGRALAYHHRAIAFQKIGQQDAAIGDYSRAILANALSAPVLSRAYYNRGIAYGNSGRSSEAEQDYWKAIELAPDYAAAYHNLANLERRRHAYSEAIAHYSAAIDNMQGRERKLPLFGRALAFEQTGNFDRAATDLRQALALDPEFELASTKLTAISPQLSASKPDSGSGGTVAAAVPEPSPWVLPAALAPFQTASSGHEEGKIIRIASVGGWRTTATRFPQPEPAPKAMAEDTGTADTLITGSLRPTEIIQPEPRETSSAASKLASDTSTEGQSARYRLQLGAFREASVAAQAWAEISRQVGPAIAPLEHAIQKADLGERGIFYRLRAGAFDGIREARSACKTLEARKIECIVVDG